MLLTRKGWDRPASAPRGGFFNVLATCSCVTHRLNCIAWSSGLYFIIISYSVGADGTQLSLVFRGGREGGGWSQTAVAGVILRLPHPRVCRRMWAIGRNPSRAFDWNMYAWLLCVAWASSKPLMREHKSPAILAHRLGQLWLPRWCWW